MRIRVFSDIHLEFADWEPPAADADVVVIAGDLHPKRKGLAWISRHFAESGAGLWVHGHTHRSVDYQVGRTRVFANQRGYPGQAKTGFDERAVLVV